MTLDELRYSDGSIGWRLISLDECDVFKVDVRVWSLELSEVASHVIRSSAFGETHDGSASAGSASAAGVAKSPDVLGSTVIDEPRALGS